MKNRTFPLQHITPLGFISPRRYFHGFLTNQKSDNMLNGALQSDSGSAYFLVKYSFDSIGEFILTFINGKGRYLFTSHLPRHSSPQIFLLKHSLDRISYVKIRNISGMWQIGTSPKKYSDWTLITTVCKQVIGIGTPICARR